jgi:hypothetical protein
MSLPPAENPLPPTDYYPGSEVVAAAREVIRREFEGGEGCPVSIGDLLDELSNKFGDRFRVSPDMYKLVNLIEMLWDDPDIHHPNTEWVEFAWNDVELDPGPFTGLNDEDSDQAPLAPLRAGLRGLNDAQASDK